ncbi:hypothetical protein OCH239_15655 [Roseivivax halodurans JCM 10272]|uniref:Glycosyltransferase 2-like domain-containing protein n=1 Tax=Roseivivax halodurans JCM 10272 TaxID=1449350 RepID=X7E9V0_9RHOB|nr:glycosyltransferase family A protein [Roseivivax halodurans]ETX12859.1 hypothetical protein OCH239_15655 [Roseivivax halodurans JCM 10272]
MSAAPRISVILPAYDVAPYVAQTITSLSEQDWPDLELIAVDDGSTDDTQTVLDHALAQFRRSGPGRRAKLVTQDNGGLGAARNAGLAQATGGLILFADGDDLLDAGAIPALAHALEAEPRCCLVFPRCRYIDEDGAPMGLESGRRDARLSAADLLFENPIHTDTGVLLRREALDRAGPFDPHLPSAVGLDAWMRVASGQGACILQVPYALVSYRRRSRQITGDWRRQRDGWEAVAQRARSTKVIGRVASIRARSRAMLVWAAGAYDRGDRAALRSLVLGALARDPLVVLGSDHGRLKLVAAAASLLPQPVERALSAWYLRRSQQDAGAKVRKRR